LLDGRYRVIERLGSGGVATVFLAEDERLGRRVAVKRLHAETPEDMARRFEREAKLGASLNHPNVVQVYDTSSDDEGVLIVMEYVQGETLAQAMRAGPIDRERALEIVRCIAHALDHAHEHGVVHRDVKPANVLLGRNGTCKLTDLGIATAAERTQITSIGTVLGTPSYMAPEQLEGLDASPAVDVYSLAAVAFEMLGGRKARTGRTPLEIAHRAASEPPPDLREAWPDAPDAAAELVQRAMSRDPSERPASAGALAEELTEALSAAPEEPTAATVPLPARPAPPPPSAAPSAPPPAVLPARPGPPRRLPARALVAGLLVLGLVVTAIALLAGGGGDEPPDRSTERATPGTGSQGGEPGPAKPAPSEERPSAGGEGSAPGAGSGERSGSPNPAEGARLNDEGKSLIDAGKPEEAVPVLERAVASFPEDTKDLSYAYALFNLGNALRLSGRPDEAIPILERRLRIDNQREAVQRELDRAKQDAGR
jgi:eukaryotic-like serine/threonine-protein kinase